MRTTHLASVRTALLAPDGTDVGGIAWNSHFTELRIAITNPSESDYQDLDVVMRPDKMVYKAAILDQSSMCGLKSISGNVFAITHIKKSGKMTVTGTRIGEGIELHDDTGNTYTPMVSDGGYRLTCSKLPADFTIQVVFAVIAVTQQVIQGTPRPELKKPEEWGLGLSEWSGVNSEFDMMDTRPSPNTILYEGQLYKNCEEIFGYADCRRQRRRLIYVLIVPPGQNTGSMPSSHIS